MDPLLEQLLFKNRIRQSLELALVLVIRHGLIYFRTTEPGDITTFKRIPAMTGSSEKRCTYPKFMRDAEGRLIFHYRDGGSAYSVVYDERDNDLLLTVRQHASSGCGNG